MGSDYEDMVKLEKFLASHGILVTSSKVIVDRDTANQCLAKGDYGGYSFRDLSRHLARKTDREYVEVVEDDYRSL